MNLMGRVRAAVGMVLRGSIAPFDRIGVSISGPDRMVRGYSESIWVHAAIRHIAGPIAAVSLEHSAKPSGGRGLLRQRSIRRRAEDTMVSDPRLDAFWQAPARGLDGLGEFIGAVVGWRKLAGEAFLLLGDDAVVPFPEARTMSPVIVARPDRMRHVLRDGQVVGWEYTDGSGRRHALTPEQVIHLRQWNPYDDHRGLGEFEVARVAAETDRAASTFARNLASSQGDQGVYVVAKGGVIEEKQRDQITALLMEKRRMQQQGIFRPVFLTGDITVEDPKVRSVDAAFLESRRMSAGEIFVAFGVPPSMAKEQPSYSIGSASDSFRLISDTCIPESARIAEAISRVSSLVLGRPVFASFCWDEHPVLQEVRKERLGVVDGLWNKGVPLRAISDYLDLDLPRFPGDDMGWLPISVVPAEQAASLSLDPGPEGEPGIPAAPAAPVEPPDDEEPEETEDPEDAPEPGEPVRSRAPADPVAAALAALRSPRARATSADARLWARHIRQRQPAVRAYASAFSRALFAARAEVLRKIASAPQGSPRTARDAAAAAMTPPAGSDASQAAAVACGGHVSGAPLVRAGAVDLLFDLFAFKGALKAAFRRVTEGVLQKAVDQLSAELGKDDPLKFPPMRALQFIRGRENRLEGVADEVFSSVKSTLEEGLNSGDTMAELAARVRAQFSEMSRGRARRIAMTETAAAYGTARQEGMTQAGVEFKRWLNSGGDNVREAHMEANNQTVPVDAPFLVGGEELMHPGDPSGRPDNVINCHCVSVAVASPDDGLNPQ